MRIGIDIRTLMDAQYSGVPEFTLNLVNEILRLDQKNEYQLFYNSLKNPKIPKFDFPNVRIVKTNYPNKILNYLLFKTFDQPKIDKKLGVDLFFAPHINFISLSTDCKSVLTLHDLSFLRHPEFFSLRKNFWHKMINVKKLLNRFDKIVAVSENTKNDAIELCGVDKSKIKVIYSGINKQNAVSQPFSVVGREELPEKFILYLGTLEPRKNVDGIIKAYNILREKNKNLNDVKLVIAGGKGWKFKDIFTAYETSEFKNDIIFLGYIDDKDKSYIYSAASLFVYPSFYEGFGFPVLEAMSYGVPILTSSLSSLPEVAGGAAIMVNPFNINEIAMAMEKILSDKELRDNLINKGFERVKLFNWNKTASEYLKLFEDLIT